MSSKVPPRHPLVLPIPGDLRVRRFAALGAGLVLFGVSLALMLAAGLGVPSWDVLHQGLAQTLGIPFGWMVNAASLAVLVLWIPLRQRPGVGTLANAVVVGVVADATLAILPDVGPAAARVAMLVLGVAANGLATGLYIGAGLGPGPRDGLMTGLAARSGRSIRSARLSIEVAVLAAGWLLGGPVGVGTVLFAAAIGPLTQASLERLAIPAADERPSHGASPFTPLQPIPEVDPC